MRGSKDGASPMSSGIGCASRQLCQRRELKFLARLPESEALREEIAWSIEWYDSNVDDLRRELSAPR